MKDSLACGKRHVSRIRLLAMLLLCVVPLTAYGEELPVHAVVEPAAPTAPVIEPTIPAPVNHPPPQRNRTTNHPEQAQPTHLNLRHKNRRPSRNRQRRRHNRRQHRRLP